jgi:quercetin dioxygenase-like cupin family protein
MFMTQTTTAARGFHRGAAEGPSYWGPGDTYTWLVTGEESDGQYFSMLAVVPPNGGPPPHIHDNEDETFYVLEGQPTFRIGDERVVGGPGDFVNVPKGVLHNFHNGTDSIVKMILTFTPAGIERFFEETLERCHDLTQDCPDNLAEVGARFGEAGPRYGITFYPEA